MFVDSTSEITGSRRRRRSPQLRIGLPLLFLLAFVVVAAIGYKFIDPQYSWIDSFYMTVITITTVGLREVHPLSALGQGWTIFVIIGGLTAGAVVLSMLGAMVVEGQIRRILGRRQLERKISSLSGHVIICGYGRMGKLVAAKLVAAGRDVVVVDSDPDCTGAAQEAGLLYILGDAQEESVLKVAGVARAEVLLATLPGDAANVFLTLSARQTNESLKIIARAQQAATQDMLLKAGATRVICPQDIGASRMVNVVLRPAVVDFVEMAHRGLELEMEQLEVVERSSLVGRTLQQLALPGRIGAHLVAVCRAGGEVIYQPTPALTLAAGDTIVLVGPKGVAAAVEKLQRQTG